MAQHAATPAGEPDEDETSVTASEPDSDAAQDEAPGGAHAAGSDADTAESVPTPAVAPRKRMSHVRLALIVGVLAVLVLGGLAGWLGLQANRSYHLAQQRQLFLEVGRQGALNLTTLDYEHIDGDVQRILDSATGTFYDDFQKRAPSFTDVVKQVKSKSQGTVTATALESGTPTEAQVLVEVTVKSEIVGQPPQRPRSLRMRISVAKVADGAKVSNVEFVA